MCPNIGREKFKVRDATSYKAVTTSFFPLPSFVFFCIHLLQPPLTARPRSLSYPFSCSTHLEKMLSSLLVLALAVIAPSVHATVFVGFRPSFTSIHSTFLQRLLPRPLPLPFQLDSPLRSPGRMMAVPPISLRLVPVPLVSMLEIRFSRFARCVLHLYSPL